MTINQLPLFDYVPPAPAAVADDGIPACLRLTQDQRRCGWERQPPHPMPKFSNMNETTRAYYESIRVERERKKQEGLARLKEINAERAAERAETRAIKEEAKRVHAKFKKES